MDQSLGVDLAVLQLLVSISLNTLQQSRQRLLLLLTKESLLTLDCLLKSEAHLVFILLLLHLLTLDLQELGLLVPLHEHQLTDFVFELHQSTRKLRLVLELAFQFLMQLLDFERMLFL